MSATEWVVFTHYRFMRDFVTGLMDAAVFGRREEAEAYVATFDQRHPARAYHRIIERMIR